MRVSIKDIAKAAQVSHSTVSRALSDSPLVNAATKARIQRLAREMGYSPDAIARSLVMQKTHTVGVVVTTILKRIGMPVVLINNHNKQSGRYTFSVSVDNQHGGLLATSHLIQWGHRRIGYVSGPVNHSDDAERLDGYRQALDEAGIAFDLALVVQSNGRLDGGERALRTLAELDEAPTAVFCYNDMTAIGLISEARRAGLSVPADLAVIGFDDTPMAVHFCSPMTAIAQPQRDMGRQAMDMALTLMAADDSTAPFSDIVVKGKLMVRKTT